MSYSLSNANSGSLRVPLIGSLNPDQQEEAKKQKKCATFYRGYQDLIHACKQIQGFQDDNLVRTLCLT